MKILAIGDIHGRSCWEKIVDQNFDIVVFIGDYLDTYDDNITPRNQVDNLKNIIDFKLKFPEKVKLIVGNHDYHYMRGINDHYAGFQLGIKFDVEEILHNNKDLFQSCFIYDKYCFTHAGITNTWLKTVKEWFIDNGLESNGLENTVNLLFEFKPTMFKFTSGEYFDQHGNEVTQTPFWIRPEALIKDRILNYFHVIGHTPGDPEIISFVDGGIIKIDCLESGYYLEIDNGSPIFKKW